MTSKTKRSVALRDLEGEVWVMIRRIRRTISERAVRVHPELAVAPYLMLAYLNDDGPRRSSELVGALGVDKAAISRNVTHLVELGLVERSPDPADGRATILAASPTAMARLAEVSEERRRQIDDALADWTDDELADFVRTLGRYNRSHPRAQDPCQTS